MSSTGWLSGFLPRLSGRTRPSYCPFELGHNIEACAPSRMTSLLSWIVTSTKRRASTPLALAFDVLSVAGRPARTIFGRVAAATCGTRSIREECAPPASTGGLQHSISRVSGGRRTRNGIRIDGDQGRLLGLKRIV